MSTTYKADASIYERINLVMSDVERLHKGGKHKHHGFMFLGHDDVTQAIRRAFVRYGIVQRVTLIDAQRIVNDMVAVRVQIDWIAAGHDSRMTVESYGESSVGGKGGPSPQQSAQAISYAVKTAQLKNFCLVGDDTEDSDMSYSDGPAPQQAAPVVFDSHPEVQLALAELDTATSQGEAKRALAKLATYADTISAELSERIGELAGRSY